MKGTQALLGMPSYPTNLSTTTRYHRESESENISEVCHENWFQVGSSRRRLRRHHGPHDCETTQASAIPAKAMAIQRKYLVPRHVTCPPTDMSAIARLAKPPMGETVHPRTVNTAQREPHLFSRHRLNTVGASRMVATKRVIQTHRHACPCRNKLIGPTVAAISATAEPVAPTSATATESFEILESREPWR